jgi:uncharacterized Zn finger protein
MVVRCGICGSYYEALKLIRCEITRKVNIIISVCDSMKAFQIKLVLWEKQEI